MPAVPERDFQSEQDEIERVKRAIGVVVQHLQEQAKLPKGEIFAAHSMMLSDPELWASVEARIQTGMIAEQAWIESLQTLADEFRQAESQYMREREADVHDIARQVMVEMTGVTPNAIDIQEPSILLARDLMPSDVAGLDKSKVLGICLSEGGKPLTVRFLLVRWGFQPSLKLRAALMLCVLVKW